MADELTTTTDKMAAMKRVIFADNPAPCTALESIREICADFDRTYAAVPEIGIIEYDVVDTIYKAFGKPKLPKPADVVVPVAPAEAMG